MKTGNSELVSTKEIARRLGITPGRIRTLNQEGRMPAPVGVIGGRTIWRWAHVRTWAIKTGRLEP